MNHENGPRSSDRHSFSPSTRGFPRGTRGGSFPSRRGFRASRRGFRGGRNRGNNNNNNNNYYNKNNSSFGGRGNFVPRGRGTRGSSRSRRPFRGRPSNRSPRGDPSSGESHLGLFRLYNEAAFQKILDAHVPKTTEEKDELAKKVLADRFVGCEVDLMLTVLGSRVFVKLLQISSYDVISPTLSKIVNASAFLATDSVGSKGLGYVLTSLGCRLEKCHEESKNAVAGKKKLRGEVAAIVDVVSRIAVKVIDGLGSNLDLNACSALKVLLPTLAGKQPTKGIETDWVFEEWKFPVPSVFSTCLENLNNILMELDIAGMLEKAPFAYLIQTVLHFCRDSNPDLFNNVIEKVISSPTLTGGGSSEKPELPIGFTERAHTFFTQDILLMLSPSSFQKMLERYQPLFATMAEHPTARFVLQKMLEGCHTKQQVVAMFGELKPLFENIEERKSLGTLVTLAKALAKHGCKQKLFTKILKLALNYSDGDGKSFIEFFLAKLFDKDSQEKEVLDERRNGSNMLQMMMQFTDCREVITTFVALDRDVLINVSRDKHTCFMFTNFFKSPSVTDDEKTELINKLMDDLVSMARDRYGQYVVTEMWSYSSLPLKLSIAEELAKHLEVLQSKGPGIGICRKFNLVRFTKNPMEWQRELEKGIQNGTSSLAVEMREHSDEDNEMSEGEESDDPDSNEDDVEKAVGSEDEDDASDEEPEEEESDEDSDGEDDEEEEDDDEEEEEEDMEILKVKKVTTVNLNKRKMDSAPVSRPGPKSKKQKIGQKLNSKKM